MPPYPLHRQISIFLSPSFARSLRAKTIDVYVSSQNITKNRTSIVFVHERSKIKRMEKRALEFVYLQEIGFCNFDLGYVYFCILFPFASQKLLQIRPSRLSRLYIDRYVRAQRGQSFDRSRTSWTGATFLSLHPFQSNSQVLATRISLDRVHFAPIDAAIPIHPISGINPSWDQTSSLLLRLRLGESIHNFFQPNFLPRSFIFSNYRACAQIRISLSPEAKGHLSSCFAHLFKFPVPQSSSSRIDTTIDRTLFIIDNWFINFFFRIWINSIICSKIYVLWRVHDIALSSSRTAKLRLIKLRTRINL